MFSLAQTPLLRRLPKAMAAYAMTFVAFFGFLGSDMYLPLMPMMMHDMHTTAHWMEFSVTAYLMGVVSMQLVMGPWSDVVGRRPVVLVGLLCTMLGHWVDAHTYHIIWFCLGRFLAGVGTAGGLSLARIVARDCYEGKALARMTSWFALTVGISPMIAPPIGGWLGVHDGWPAIFEFMVGLYGVLLVVFLCGYPETLEKKQPFRWSQFTGSLRDLLKDPVYRSAALIMASMFAAFMAYVTASPLIFQHDLAFSLAAYVRLTFILSLMNVGGKFLNVCLLRRYTVASIVGVMSTVLVVAATGLMLQRLFWPNPWAYVLWVGLLVLGFATLGPNISSTALNRAGRHAIGVAGALYGTLQMVGSFLGSALAAAYAHQGLMVVSWLWLVVALVICWLFRPVRHLW